MNTEKHETWQGLMVRKLVKKLSALATIAGDVIWRPPPGTMWILRAAYVKPRTITGTVTDEPNIKLTNSSADIVAAVDLVSTVTAQRLTVTGNVVITHDLPLTLVSADAQNGGTVYDYDIVLFADRLSY